MDDINRFARDVVAHFTLKEAVKQSSSELECVNMKLEDNSEGHFIETIMTASAEMEFIENLHAMLAEGDLHQKKLVQKFVLCDLS